MAIDRQIARIAKILVDRESISFDEAQARLRGLTLEIVVDTHAVSSAAHAAILTAVLVGSRTFVGGVRVVGEVDEPLNSALPLNASTIAEACIQAGARVFEGVPSRRVLVGNRRPSPHGWSVSPWWNGWVAGVAPSPDARCDSGRNPLTGIAAGALAVAAAFEAERGNPDCVMSVIDLWPAAPGVAGPDFDDVFLPGAVWIIGLGNLGQALLWSLTSLPYRDPADVSLVLQDHDVVSEENWGTSVLVNKESYGVPKTRIAEQWALDKGFRVRRIDRRLLAHDRLEDGDPRLALSGVDKVQPRRQMANVGFDCIVDSGLGRTSSDFDRYRVTVFDQTRRIDKHFADQNDEPVDLAIPEGDAYQRLQAEIGRCGTAEIGGASVAVPYVSAVAASVAISRAIAVVCGSEFPANEVGVISSLAARKTAPVTKVVGRGVRHAGKPDPRLRQQC